MSLSFLTFPMARDEAKALDWVLQDSETMMFTILQDSYRLLGDSDRIRDGQAQYYLYRGPPAGGLTGVPMLDLLLLEAFQDPTRNARYKLNAKQCAQIAQSLWLSVLPL
jgi:hypothetical protein